MARLMRPLLPISTSRHGRAESCCAMFPAMATASPLTEPSRLADDSLACTVMQDVLGSAWPIAPDPLACPITIAWSEKDSVLPVTDYERNVRDLLPHAVFKVLPDVGHVPMADDPGLVAHTIVAATELATD